ncbi:4Fe-4S dicluster domain-containing protein [Selenomonas ruminantium]|uniref:Formate dehydrogenase iron-sulfur subunit n=1 Tax=Selenomonas ruminantium TaxID=971 RepID=A0A1H0SJR8_SELRU|nr:4Fe-4S dicluster domain-containing protein [Selenomonas ruminantium]SDP41915.1 formate dehydrogenase iron-sulfur subunit [Selenomonas ruminantium]
MAQEITMLHDVVRCSACRACMVACKQWHDLPADMSTPFEGQYQSHKDLTSHTLNLIQMQERIDSKGKFHWDFFKKQCMHCGDPACLNGCPEEAIEKKPSGAVVIDEDKCVGCGYCTTNCPFGIPKVDAERNKSTKCDLCFDRIEQGMQPSCAKTCTADAILFGTREEMLKKAEERLTMIKDTHPDANIYNPQGVGGVHMLYVLPEKPAVYGLPENPRTPDSINLWKDVVRPVGKLASVGAIAGVLGLTALTAMRRKGDK